MSESQTAENIQNNQQSSNQIQIASDLSVQTSLNSQSTLPIKNENTFQQIGTHFHSPDPNIQSEIFQSQISQYKTGFDNLLSDRIHTDSIDSDINTSFQTLSKEKIIQSRKNSFRSLQNLIDDIKKVGDARSNSKSL